MIGSIESIKHTLIAKQTDRVSADELRNMFIGMKEAGNLITSNAHKLYSSRLRVLFFLSCPLSLSLDGFTKEGISSIVMWMNRTRSARRDFVLACSLVLTSRIVIDRLSDTLQENEELVEHFSSLLGSYFIGDFFLSFLCIRSVFPLSLSLCVRVSHRMSGSFIVDLISFVSRYHHLFQSLVPLQCSICESITNSTDRITKNIGTTLSSLWIKECEVEVDGDESAGFDKRVPYLIVCSFPFDEHSIRRVEIAERMSLSLFKTKLFERMRSGLRLNTETGDNDPSFLFACIEYFGSSCGIAFRQCTSRYNVDLSILTDLFDRLFTHPLPIYLYFINRTDNVPYHFNVPIFYSLFALMIKQSPSDSEQRSLSLFDSFLYILSVKNSLIY